MALFMQRLGVALAPVFASTQGSSTGDFQSLVRTCETQPLAISGYPRTAEVSAAIHAFFPTATKTLLARIVYSEDGGVNYISPGAYFSQSVDPGRSATWGDLLPAVPLVPGRNYRFAVEIIATQFGGASGSGTVGVECKLRTRIDAANPTTAPFDAE